MINWKIRFKNKLFWLAVIPALFLLAQQILEVCGISMDFTNLQDKILAIVNTVFELLAIFGIVTDMTTAGASDSTRALSYTRPYQEGDKVA